MALQADFGLVDYIVMAITIVISMGIGVFYGFVKKQQTTEEYLYGNRQMHLLPVALSLAVTFQSAVSVLGLPAEIYTYGTMAFYTSIGGMLATATSALVIVPLLYPLKLNSAYEYLGRRFDSRSVQLLGTYIGMLQTLLYMSVVLFSPALALEAVLFLIFFLRPVAGIPLWISVIVVGTVGTLYTSLGGFKSVIWTDVFQFIILYGGLVVILVLGGREIGSFGEILDIAADGNRMSFSASFDPRVRHTIWGCVIGGIFLNLPNCCNQSAVQRMCSMKNSRDARIAILLNIPFNLVFTAVIFWTAIIVYSYFAKHQCDPIEAGYIDGANQLMPYFVLVVFHGVPALAGIFIAALFSGSLSSLSSGINALAANTLQDILINYTAKMSQVKQTLLAKLIVFVYGVIVIGLAYAMRAFDGPVTQIANTAFGAAGGPYVGMFFLGAMFPQANWVGAFVGGILGVVFNVWFAVSAMFMGHPAPHAPPISTSGCDDVTATIANSTSPYTSFQSTPTYSLQSITQDSQLTESVTRDHFVFYDISYLYFGMTGFLVSLVCGLVVSLLVNCCPGGKHYHKTDPMYIFPILRGLWKNRDYATTVSYNLSGKAVDGSWEAPERYEHDASQTQSSTKKVTSR